MNLLFLNSARGWGGNEQWTFLAAHSLSRDHGVYFAYRKETVGDRFRVPKFRFPFRHEFDLATLCGLVKVIRQHRVDVLVPTKRKDYVLAGIAARFCGIKNVLRLGIVRELKKNLINRLIYGRLCDGMIVNAKSIKRTLLESDFMKSEKIRVIYNGVDWREIEKKAEEFVAWVKPSPFTVVSLGELSERKGHDLLLNSFACFLRQSSGFQKCGIVLIGEGTQRDRLEKISQDLHVEKHVHFLGFQDNPFPYIKKCDVFVSASKNEGISNAVLEAMVLGLPVISTNAGGMEECFVNGENGHLVGDGDVRQLAEVLLTLYRDPQKRKQLGSAGRKRVIQTFSTERMAEEILNFCTELFR